MREAIERVIAELTERRGEHASDIRIWGNTPELYGRTKELEHCIKLLKEVLNATDHKSDEHTSNAE
jgi:hypothetical protein